MDTQDLFTISTLNACTVSPDGTWIIATVGRPLEGNREVFPGSGLHADLWLINRRTGEHRILTSGAVDGRDNIMADWSPDGKRVAFLAKLPASVGPTERDVYRLCVWDRATNATKTLAVEGVMYQRARIEGNSGRQRAPFLWLDNETLLAVFLPSDAGSLVTPELLRATGQMWQQKMEGKCSTADVLDSLTTVLPDSRLQHALLKTVDVAGRQRQVADLPVMRDEGMQLSVAPDKKSLAIITQVGSASPVGVEQLQQVEGRRLRRLGLITLSEAAAVRWIDGNFGEAAVSSLDAWAPDGSALLVWARRNVQDEDVSSPFLVAQDGSVRRLLPAEFDGEAAQWTVRGQLLVYASPGASPSARPSAGRLDRSRAEWWHVDTTGAKAPLNVTASLASVPRMLFRLPASEELIGVARGQLWAINPETESPVALLDAESIPKDAAIVGSEGFVGPAVLITGHEGGHAQLQRVTLGNLRDSHRNTVAAVPMPDQHAVLTDYRPEAGFLLFKATTDDGTFLWAQDSLDPAARELVSLNSHMAKIAGGQHQFFRYLTVDGESVGAEVLLPPDYKPGARYPVVAWIYPGDIQVDSSSVLTRKIPENTRNLVFSLQLLAARGYVVLIPSLPLGMRGKKGDVHIELPKGVIPAVDKLIDLGIADPDRLAVMGHSFGGYGVFSLVTYTHRFKAAIALAGIVDLVSNYGEYFPSARYGGRTTGAPWMAWSEGGGGRLGGPPWDDLWHAWRNSPLYYLDRVRTPLLICQGDNDAVSIAQGEQAYTALYRLGKRVRFVRYWGEGHILESPANIKHMWGEIFDWLDEYLGPVKPYSSAEMRATSQRQ